MTEKHRRLFILSAPPLIFGLFLLGACGTMDVDVERTVTHGGGISFYDLNTDRWQSHPGR